MRFTGKHWRWLVVGGLLWLGVARAEARVMLWPLLMDDGEKTTVLWPFFSYNRATGDIGAWPLYREEGDGVDILWPFFHWSPERKRILPFVKGLSVVETPTKSGDGTTTQSAPYWGVLPFYLHRDLEGPDYRSNALLAYWSLVAGVKRWGVFPLFHRRVSGPGDTSLLILNFVLRRGPDRFFTGLLPWWYGRRGAADDPEARRDYGVFPVYWGTKQGEIPYFVVAPLFYRRGEFWTLFPFLWNFERGFAFFPLFGQGVKTVEPPHRGPGAPPAYEKRWRYALWPLYFESETPWRKNLLIFPALWRMKESGSMRQGPFTTERELRVTMAFALLSQWQSLREVTQPVDIEKHRGTARERLETRGSRVTLLSALGLVQLFGYENVFAEDAIGGVYEDLLKVDVLTATPLFSLYSSERRLGEDGKTRRRRSLLTLLYRSSKTPTTRSWSVLGCGASRRPGERSVTALWGLFEWTKHDDGDRSGRIFFIPVGREEAATPTPDPGEGAPVEAPSPAGVEVEARATESG